MASDESTSQPIRYYGQRDLWGLGQLREGWQSRELLYSFFLRDLLIRYRQVFVGVLWVLIQPLMSTLIFLALFFVLGANRTDSGEVTSTWDYDPIILVGILLWKMVKNSFRDATGSLVNYRHVVTKIYFPRMLLPLSSLLCAVFDMLVGSVLILPVCYFSGVTIHWDTAILALVAALWLVVFCFGCILWLSALNAHYRDVGYALPFVLQIGMFVSPVVYGTEKIRHLLSPWLLVAYESNPVAATISLARYGLFGLPMPSVIGMMLALGVTLGLVVSGLSWFQRANQWIADRI
ncbi:MAG: ABC transporter permease [Pirellula sp.]